MEHGFSKSHFASGFPKRSFFVPFRRTNADCGNALLIRRRHLTRRLAVNRRKTFFFPPRQSNGGFPLSDFLLDALFAKSTVSKQTFTIMDLQPQGGGLGFLRSFVVLSPFPGVFFRILSASNNPLLALASQPNSHPRKLPPPQRQRGPSSPSARQRRISLPGFLFWTLFWRRQQPAARALAFSLGFLSAPGNRTAEVCAFLGSFVVLLFFFFVDLGLTYCGERRNIKKLWLQIVLLGLSL